MGGKVLYKLLTPEERGRPVLLCLMIMIMAMLDVIGIVSVLPFISLLSNPALIQTNQILATTYETLGFTDFNGFLIFLGMLSFSTLVFSLAFKALTTFTQLRFAVAREFYLSRRLVEGYLRQPYEWFLSRNSSDLSKTILSEVSVVVNGGLIPVLDIFAQSAVVTTILLMLLVTDPFLTVIVALTLCASYLLIFGLVRSFLNRIGVERFEANKLRYSTLQEAFGAVKELKVSGLEEVFIRRFVLPAKTYAKHYASMQAVSSLPRFGLEALAFGGIQLIILYFMLEGRDFTSAIPILALYAFAGYRLLPAVQQIYHSFSQLSFAGPAVKALETDLVGLQQINLSEFEKTDINLQGTITLKGITYCYPGSEKPALQDINIDIPINQNIGLVGLTGSGKTTLVDVLLGLLSPSEGELKVDGVSIDNSNRRGWQKCVGYVPQNIFLSDDTIAKNIAFGSGEAEIKLEAVQRAAKIANLHDFIITDLKDGYDSFVGERGVKLSGGQRQRIGIARALYHKPQVLIFDEATSALDNLTERAVMDAINSLRNDLTIIQIAHRLSTLTNCDNIYLLENGKNLAQGTFDLLAETNQTFRDMAGM